MSKPRAPAAPDPQQVAAAQSASNRDTAVTDATLNSVNQVTPYGSVTYDWGAPVNGVPTRTQTTTFSPTQQALFDLEQQQGIALGNLGLEQTNRVSDILSSPFDPRRYNVREDMGGEFNGGDANSFLSDVRGRSFNLATEGLSGEFDRAEENLRSRLANQGITQGSDAYDAELAAFNRGRGNAFSDALLAADSNALATQGQMFGQQLGARQQNVAEGEADYGRSYSADLAQRQIPLQEITAILNGNPLTPLNPAAPSSASVAPTNVLGAYQMQQQALQNQYNQQMGARNALIGGLAGLGGAAFGAFGGE